MDSWLKKEEGNLFQEIKKISAEAAAAGKKLIKLSIGQPLGPALPAAREKAAECVLKGEDCWHEYQDNFFLPFQAWDRSFCLAHLKHETIDCFDKLDFMPIPGIKPMLGLIPLACGGSLRAKVSSMTDPGYPVPKTWCEYLGVSHQPFVTDPANFFLPNLGWEENERKNGFNLAMFNLPHNPTGQIATRDYWREVCAFCQERGIRIFNDAAYILLSHSPESCSLADVAVEFPGLSWMEAYSSSKEIGNGTGWRVGAVIGSPDFVSDLRKIKGNTDSGFFAPAAAGALHALETCQDELNRISGQYKNRLSLLAKILADNGLIISLNPGAGFFILCKSPQAAFGRKMESSKDFNITMIKETGIVGVHMGPYIRYAVCGPVEEWLAPISEGFEKAHPEYA